MSERRTASTTEYAGHFDHHGQLDQDGYRVQTRGDEKVTRLTGVPAGSFRVVLLDIAVQL